MNIPDEAVEAAGDALLGAMGRGPHSPRVDIYSDSDVDIEGRFDMQAAVMSALEAAAPFIAAQAWDEGATNGLSWDEALGEEFKAPNPYRKATHGND